MQVVARRKIRKKYALPGDSMKFSKAPGDKRSPSTTCNRKDCKQERLSNTLLPKEHSNYERPTACHQRCLDCCRSQAGVESLSHETWPKEQRKTEHPGPSAVRTIIHTEMLCLCQHHSTLVQQKTYHNSNQHCSVLSWRRNLAIKCMQEQKGSY